MHSKLFVMSNFCILWFHLGFPYVYWNSRQEYMGEGLTGSPPVVFWPVGRSMSLHWQKVLYHSSLREGEFNSKSTQHVFCTQKSIFGNTCFSARFDLDFFPFEESNHFFCFVIIFRFCLLYYVFQWTKFSPTKRSPMKKFDFSKSIYGCIMFFRVAKERMALWTVVLGEDSRESLQAAQIVGTFKKVNSPEYSLKDAEASWCKQQTHWKDSLDAKWKDWSREGGWQRMTDFDGHESLSCFFRVFDI